MNPFQKNDEHGPPCPICDTSDPGQCVLIPIEGTREGETCQAVVVHVNCIDPYFIEKDGEYMLFQYIGRKNK